MKRIDLLLPGILVVIVLCIPAACAQDVEEKTAPSPTAKSQSEKSATDKNQSEASPAYNPMNFPDTEGAVQLRPTHGRITLKMTDNSRVVYESVGRQGKINVLFDPEYTPTSVSVDLAGVSLQDALKILAFQTRTFWRPVTSDTIFVSADTNPKRVEFEPQVVRTFYFPNIWTPTDLQDIVNALRTIIEVKRIQQLPTFQSITIRATPEQMAAAEKLIDDLNRSKSKTGGQYKLEFRITEAGEEQKNNARVFELLVEPHELGKLRIGPRIPIETKDHEKTYMEAGKNFDCQIRLQNEHSVGLRLTVEFTDAGRDEHGAPQIAHDEPVLQQLKIDTSVTLELGVPTIVTGFQDPISKHSFQVEATAIRTKTKE